MTDEKAHGNWGVGRCVLPISFGALALLFTGPGAGLPAKALVGILLGGVFCLFDFGKYSRAGKAVTFLSWQAGALCACLGVARFRHVWAEAALLPALGDAWQLNSLHMIYLCGVLLAVLCVPATAAAFALLLHPIDRRHKLLPQLDALGDRLLQNRYLPLSAVFFCAMWAEQEASMLAECAAMALSVIFCAWLPRFSGLFQGKKRGILLLAGLGTVNMCWYLKDLAWYWGKLAIPMMVLAAPFLMAALLVFWERLEAVFRENSVFSGVCRWEWCLYGLMLLLNVSLCIWVYSQTVAFHAAQNGDIFACDVIYTSDSGYLTLTNAYMNFLNSENDIRSPLFALFAAPLSALTYLPRVIFRLSLPDSYLLVNLLQLAMLLLSFFLLARAAELSSGQRAAFMLISFCTYTYQLFGLMMEQYIFTFFWVCLAVFQFCRQGKADPMVLIGAGGTMLTSLALVPFMVGENPKKSFRRWFWACAGVGIAFLLLIIGIGRSDILFDMERIRTVRSFMSLKPTNTQKFIQYSWFVRNVFLAPKAGPDVATFDHPSWQLLPLASVSIPGIVLFLSAAFCCAWGRKRPICQCCGGWILLSLLVLLAAGWGTSENGLILYSLYFGWAFLVPLFLGLCGLARKARQSWLVPAVSVAAAGLMAAGNVPEIGRLIAFAVEFYPKVG